MSYKTVHQCANDPSFLARLEACAADEGSLDPHNEVSRLRWIAATANDIEAAYAFAVTSENPDPGGDETVITDGMILGVVQANASGTMATFPPPPPPSDTATPV